MLNVCFSFGMMAKRKGIIMPAERVIELSGATNCRSLGGMKTTEGKRYGIMFFCAAVKYPASQTGTVRS